MGCEWSGGSGHTHCLIHHSSEAVKLAVSRYTAVTAPFVKKCEEYSLSCESSLCSKEWEAWQEMASTAHCINFKSSLAIKACLFPLLVTEVAHPVLAAIPFHDVDFFVFRIWYKLWFLDPRALYGGCTGSNYIP